MLLAFLALSLTRDFPICVIQIEFPPLVRYPCHGPDFLVRVEYLLSVIRSCRLLCVILFLLGLIWESFIASSQHVIVR